MSKKQIAKKRARRGPHSLSVSAGFYQRLQAKVATLLPHEGRLHRGNPSIAGFVDDKVNYVLDDLGWPRETKGVP